MAKLREVIKQTRDFESLEQETHLNLLHTTSELSGPFLKFLKQYELSQALYNILRILRGQRGTGLYCSGIGERMVTRVPDITRRVDRLEKMGLVERMRSAEDRRVVLIHITRKGEELLEEINPAMHQLSKKSLGHLTVNEKKELNRLLDKARNPK